MYKVTKFPHGTFSWAENTSTDAESAKRFYVELMGWGVHEIPFSETMTYTMFQLQGEHVAALNAMMPELQAQGVPSFWTNYVTVDDVYALADVITSAGGEILFGPAEVFDSGSMILLQDPTGARLGLWQPRNHIGAGIVNTVGAMCWNELLTWDTGAARSFYNALFGWEYHVDENGYILISNGGRNNGAMMQMDESFGQMPSMWQPYFTVADVDASIEKAGASGGAIIIPKTEAPGAGHFAYLGDPAGAHFYIIQLIQAEPWVE